MAKQSQLNKYTRPAKAKRPGVHAKSKSSKGKNCKNYVKLYRGQGR